MNHDGQFGRPRQLHLSEKYLLLQLARRVIVEVVQADFAPGDDLGPLRQLLEFLKVGVRGQFCLVRMDSDGRENKFVPLGELNPAVQRTRAGSAADGDDLFNAAIAGAGDHRLAVGVELLHFEMGVGVYEHRTRTSGVGLRTSDLGPLHSGSRRFRF